MEAGGHIGPVSTSVLAQEILPPLAAEVPIFVAGGIGHGGLIAGYLEMGAVGVQLGTRFVCAHECIAHPNFKKAFIRASARDAITSVQIDPRLPVIPVRALKNREMELCAQAARGRPNCSTAARSRWPRPSSRSSIIGRARSAAR
jgi:enoyl-[acyl-carrier protein] reductase II